MSIPTEEMGTACLGAKTSKMLRHTLANTRLFSNQVPPQILNGVLLRQQVGLSVCDLRKGWIPFRIPVRESVLEFSVLESHAPLIIRFSDPFVLCHEHTPSLSRHSVRAPPLALFGDSPKAKLRVEGGQWSILSQSRRYVWSCCQCGRSSSSFRQQSPSPRPFRQSQVPQHQLRGWKIAILIAYAAFGWVSQQQVQRTPSPLQLGFCVRIYI
jgi:hypothetical protein